MTISLVLSCHTGQIAVTPQQQPTHRHMKQYQFVLWNIVNIPNRAVRYPVKDPAHAKRLMDALADSQLLDPHVESNVFGLEILFEGSWTEWEDDHGNQITDDEADLTFLP